MTLRVNGKAIPEQAVLSELKRLMDFYGRHMSRDELGRHAEELYRRAREHAVGTQLLIEEVARRHVEAPDADVERALAEMVGKIGGEAKLDEALARQGLTREQFRASIRMGRQLDALVGRITSGVPEVTEQEVLKYHEEHPDRYVTPERAEVRHILVRPATGSEADKDTARACLLGIRQRVLEGEDFAELAAAHSECPSGKEAGGNLGWITRGTAVPEFDKAVFEDLEPGELSDPVETALGLHLIEKQESADVEPVSFDEVKERIRELMLHERRGEALSAYVEKLRAKAVIEEESEEDRARWEQVFDSFLDGHAPN
jgi:parvulin-like peptidyl-prolyl isomerase